MLSTAQDLIRQGATDDAEVQRVLGAPPGQNGS